MMFRYSLLAGSFMTGIDEDQNKNDLSPEGTAEEECRGSRLNAYLYDAQSLDIRCDNR